MAVMYRKSTFRTGIVLTVVVTSLLFGCVVPGLSASPVPCDVTGLRHIPAVLPVEPLSARNSSRNPLSPHSIPPKRLPPPVEPPKEALSSHTTPLEISLSSHSATPEGAFPSSFSPNGGSLLPKAASSGEIPSSLATQTDVTSPSSRPHADVLDDVIGISDSPASTGGDENGLTTVAERTLSSETVAETRATAGEEESYATQSVQTEVSEEKPQATTVGDAINPLDDNTDATSSGAREGRDRTDSPTFSLARDLTVPSLPPGVVTASSDRSRETLFDSSTPSSGVSISKDSVTADRTLSRKPRAARDVKTPATGTVLQDPTTSPLDAPVWSHPDTTDTAPRDQSLPTGAGMEADGTLTPNLGAASSSASPNALGAADSRGSDGWSDDRVTATSMSAAEEGSTLRDSEDGLGTSVETPSATETAGKRHDAFTTRLDDEEPTTATTKAMSECDNDPTSLPVVNETSTTNLTSYVPMISNALQFTTSPADDRTKTSTTMITRSSDDTQTSSTTVSDDTQTPFTTVSDDTQTPSTNVSDETQTPSTLPMAWTTGGPSGDHVTASGEGQVVSTWTETLTGSGGHSTEATRMDGSTTARTSASSTPEDDYDMMSATQAWVTVYEDIDSIEYSLKHFVPANFPFLEYL